MKYDFDYPEDKLIVLSQAVKVVVEDKVKYTDWSQRDDIKAELKVGRVDTGASQARGQGGSGSVIGSVL